MSQIAEKAISEKTRITVGLVVMLLGFSAWLTQIYFQGTANAEAIRTLEAKQDKVDTMQTDIAVIKAQLSEVARKLDARERRMRDADLTD